MGKKENAIVLNPELVNEVNELRIKVTVAELIKKGKEDGNLSYKEIVEAFDDVEVEPEEIEKIYNTFEEVGISIISEVLESANDEVVTETIQPTKQLNVPSGVSVDDPVRMYLKEIGKVDLLKGEEEVDLAKQMALGDEMPRKNLLKQIFGL